MDVKYVSRIHALPLELRMKLGELPYQYGMRASTKRDKAIEAYLLGNGITRDSAEFAEQSMQLRNENNVASLPIR